MAARLSDLRCANCGREPRPEDNPDANPDQEWRAVAGRNGALDFFCPECWEREFSSRAPASGHMPVAVRRTR